MSDWRALIPAEEWQVYEKAGFARPTGLGARPAVQKGATIGDYLRSPNYQIGQDPVAVKILFGQRART